MLNSTAPTTKEGIERYGSAGNLHPGAAAARTRAWGWRPIPDWRRAWTPPGTPGGPAHPGRRPGSGLRLGWSPPPLPARHSLHYYWLAYVFCVLCAIRLRRPAPIRTRMCCASKPSTGYNLQSADGICSSAAGRPISNSGRPTVRFLVLHHPAHGTGLEMPSIGQGGIV
jgi:hypothetical protein